MVIYDTEDVLLPRMLRRRRLGEGTLELIELAGVHPMIGNAPARLAGQWDSLVAYIGPILGGIGSVAGILGNIIGIGTDLIGVGVDAVLLGLADIVSGIPVIGEFIAAILIAADVLIKLIISIPELVLKQIATLAAGMKTLTPAQQAQAFGNAAALINANAPPDIKPVVANVIKGAPAAYGVETGGGSFVDWAVGLLAAGAPIAGAAVLAA